MSLNWSRSLGLSLMDQDPGRENPLAGSFGEMENEFPVFDLPLVDWEGELPHHPHLPVLRRQH